jgi:ELWxxDGT repeat protein
MVANIGPGAGSSYPTEFVVWNNALFFLARSESGDYDLWRSAGTSESTELVADLHKGPSNLAQAILDEYLYFGAWVRDGVPGLWRTDGTPSGTELIRELPSSWQLISQLQVAGDNLFFVSPDDRGINQLWVSDGSATGTDVIRPPTADWHYRASVTNPMFTVGDELYFSPMQESLVHGPQLWRSDGTDAGTYAIEAAAGTYPATRPIEFAQLQDNLLAFTAWHPISGRETWQLHLAAAQVQLTQEESRVELFVEDEQYIVTENDVELFRAAQEEVNFLELAGDVQVAQLEINLVGGNPLPVGGVQFAGCCGPDEVVLTQGQVVEVGYVFGADVSTITIDGRTIQIANWSQHSVLDLLEAQRRQVEVLEQTSEWQVADVPGDAHIRLADGGAEDATSITVPADTSELTFRVSVGSRLAIGDGITGLPDRTILDVPLGDANDIELQLGDSWSFARQGQRDGRVVHQISDGVKEIWTYADQMAWSNPLDSYDVNGDAHTSPRDALIVIADLNQVGSRRLVSQPDTNGSTSFVDVNLDHFASPRDALLVIARLNQETGSGEESGGEGEGGTANLVDPVSEFINPVADRYAEVQVGVSARHQDPLAPRAAPQAAPPLTPLTGLPSAQSLRQYWQAANDRPEWNSEELEELLDQLAEVVAQLP